MGVQRHEPKGVKMKINGRAQNCAMLTPKYARVHEFSRSEGDRELTGLSRRSNSVQPSYPVNTITRAQQDSAAETMCR